MKMIDRMKNTIEIKKLKAEIYVLDRMILVEDKIERMIEKHDDKKMKKMDAYFE